MANHDNLYPGSTSDLILLLSIRLSNSTVKLRKGNFHFHFSKIMQPAPSCHQALSQHRASQDQPTFLMFQTRTLHQTPNP